MVVLDSSFLIAYHNPRDAHHATAARGMVQFLHGTWGHGLLLEYVFLEVVTVLRLRAGWEQAVTAGQRLLDARELEFVPCSDVFADAWSLFQQRDTPMSLADATIAAVAMRRTDGQVLTFDQDFRTIKDLRLLPG